MREKCNYCQAMRKPDEVERTVHTPVVVQADILTFCSDRNCKQLYKEERQDRQLHEMGELI